MDTPEPKAPHGQVCPVPVGLIKSNTPTVTHPCAVRIFRTQPAADIQGFMTVL